MEPENKNNQDSNKTNCEIIRELVKKNKASALGLAVLFAMGTMTTGCNKFSSQKPSTAVVMEKDNEAEDEDANTYVGGGGHGYFFYGGRPVFTGGKAYWGNPSTTVHKGGYSFTRGGSVGG